MGEKDQASSFVHSTAEIFELMEKYGHEQIVFNYDKAAGLKAIIAINDTTLGPAIGGLRMWKYKEEREAVEDAFLLSQGMTYKYAIHGFTYGGGKAVIRRDPNAEKMMNCYRRLEFLSKL